MLPHTPTRFTPLKVLVVEDDGMQQELMGIHLRNLGVKNFEVASDGNQALEMLHNNVYHVVLTDNTMPGMSGKELILSIRADGLIRHVKVAMFSGEITPLGGEEDRELRAFLRQYDVLPVSKTGLSTQTVSTALSTLVGF